MLSENHWPLLELTVPLNKRSGLSVITNRNTITRSCGAGPARFHLFYGERHYTGTDWQSYSHLNSRDSVDLGSFWRVASLVQKGENTCLVRPFLQYQNLPCHCLERPARDIAFTDQRMCAHKPITRPRPAFDWRTIQCEQSDVHRGG